MARTIKENRPPWEIKKEASKRKSGERSFLKIFKIYCEGEVTEPEYFKSFRVKTQEYNVESVGFGSTKTALVNKVLAILKELKLKKVKINKDTGLFEFDVTQVWCVFDMDIDLKKQNQKQDFDNAISLAHKYGVNVAFSNDCFELWFILHYKLIESQLSRKEYYEWLSKEWNINYEDAAKVKKYAGSIYNKLLLNQSIALQNTERLFNNYHGLNYSDFNPCTTVYKLVQELNKCLSE